MFSFINSLMYGPTQTDIQPLPHPAYLYSGLTPGTQVLELIVPTETGKIVNVVNYFAKPNAQTFCLKTKYNTMKYFDLSQKKNMAVVCAARFWALDDIIHIEGIDYSNVQRIDVSRAENRVIGVIFAESPDVWKITFFQDVQSLDAKVRDIRTLTPGNTYNFGEFQLIVNGKERRDRKKCKKRKRPENDTEFSDDEIEETKEESDKEAQPSVNETSKTDTKESKDLKEKQAMTEKIASLEKQLEKAREALNGKTCQICLESDVRDIRKAYVLKCGHALCKECFWNTKNSKFPNCPYCRKFLEFATLRDGIAACTNHMLETQLITGGETREVVEEFQRKRRRLRYAYNFPQ